MAQALGGTVAHTGAREYGRTPVQITSPGVLLGEVPRAHGVDVARRLGERGAVRVRRAGSFTARVASPNVEKISGWRSSSVSTMSPNGVLWTS